MDLPAIRGTALPNICGQSANMGRLPFTGRRLSEIYNDLLSLCLWQEL